MRILNKLKMIDWHYFQDETINFETSTLITGDNGAGKSTIIDALQVLFVANLKQIKFNSSAHDQNTKRTIKTYLRGKTGTEGSQEYLRNTDDFSSYLVLEIMHSVTGKSYLIGVVFDVSVLNNDEEHTFFKIDEETLRDNLFYVEEGLARNREQFFQYLKQQGIKYKQYKNNIGEYLSDLRQLCGGVRDSFSSIIQKGISFTPITNLRKFVYDYILDEEPVDVETMQDYFEKFKELESIIIETEKEIRALEEIEAQYVEIAKTDRNITIGYYMIKRSAWKQQEIKFNSLQEKVEKEKVALGQHEAKKKILKDEFNKLNTAIDSLTTRIAKHDITIKEQDLKKKIEQLNKDLEDIKDKRKNLLFNISVETKERSELLSKLQENGAPYEIIKGVLDGSTVWHYLTETGELEHFPKDYSLHNQQWKAGFNWLQDQQRQWQKQKKEYYEAKYDVEKKIKELKRNQILTSDHPSMKLKQLLKENLAANGAEVPVHILCEVIDVKNETWKNAVEGYLHTQKFDLLVPTVFFARTFYKKLQVIFP